MFYKRAIANRPYGSVDVFTCHPEALPKDLRTKSVKKVSYITFDTATPCRSFATLRMTDSALIINLPHKPQCGTDGNKYIR